MLHVEIDQKLLDCVNYFYCNRDAKSYTSRSRQAFSERSQTTVVLVAFLKASNNSLSTI